MPLRLSNTSMLHLRSYLLSFFTSCKNVVHNASFHVERETLGRFYALFGTHGFLNTLILNVLSLHFENVIIDRPDLSFNRPFFMYSTQPTVGLVWELAQQMRGATSCAMQ